MAGTIFSRNCWQTDTSRISHCGVCSCAHRRVGPGCWVSMWGYTRKLSANFIRIHRHVRWMRLWAHHFRLHARSIRSSDHKGDLQLSLLAQFPLVCGKNLGIPFKRRDLCQSGNVHDGKTVPFCHAGISQMLLVDRSKWMKHWKVLFLSIRIIAVLTGRWLGCSRATCYLWNWWSKCLQLHLLLHARARRVVWITHYWTTITWACPSVHCVGVGRSVYSTRWTTYFLDTYSTISAWPYVPIASVWVCNQVVLFAPGLRLTVVSSWIWLWSFGPVSTSEVRKGLTPGSA